MHNRPAMIAIIIIMLSMHIFMLWSGFQPKTDVGIMEYNISEDGTWQRPNIEIQK